MNEKKEKTRDKIITRVLELGISKYQSLYLTELAFRRYEIAASQNKKESIQESAREIMKRMPDLCRNTEGLQHKKNVVETSSVRALEELEAELGDSKTISDGLLRGDIVRNVLGYLLEK